MNRLALWTTLSVAAIAGTARAQTTLQTIPGTSAMDRLGQSVAGVGDVDRDGFADYAVGIPYADSNGLDAGTVKVFSGRTGTLLFALHGLNAGDRFGESVAGVGDVNRDGFDDFAVGAPKNSQNGPTAGMVRVYSGANASALFTFYGGGPAFWFGKSVAGAGDVDKDGWPDIVVGAPFGRGSNPSNVGQAYVYSGRNGTRLHLFNASQGIEALGMSVAGAGDVNGDGWDDLVIGAPEASYTTSEAGRAYVFNGRTGAQIYAWNGVGHGTNFGCAVGGGGDVNGDGLDDVVVGSIFNDAGPGNSGSVFVYSGANGSQLWAFHGVSAGDELGSAVAIAGDVDGDGRADVMGGSQKHDNPVANAGMARVWSGRTGQVLFTVYGQNVDDFFGSAVACAGDVDGDQLDDVIVGWPNSDVGGIDSGRARVFSARPIPVTTFCAAKTNSQGCRATMSYTGTPRAGGSSAFTVRATDAINNKAGFLFYGFGGQSVPFQGGTLCVRPPARRTTMLNSGGSPSGSDCSGVLSMDMNQWIRTHPAVTSGDTLFCQYWYRDPAGSFGTGLSNAIYFTILP